eukprot:g6795.t1
MACLAYFVLTAVFNFKRPPLSATPLQDCLNPAQESKVGLPSLRESSSRQGQEAADLWKGDRLFQVECCLSARSKIADMIPEIWCLWFVQFLCDEPLLNLPSVCWCCFMEILLRAVDLTR